MNALAASEFKTTCEKQILDIPEDLMAQYAEHDCVGMDKCVAVDEWGESMDTACQMCGKPTEEFPLKIIGDIASGKANISLPDTHVYAMVNPETGTRFEWTTCPTCAKKLRLSGVRKEASDV